MTLSTIHKWKHPDATTALNAKLETLVGPGIYWGGTVLPGVGLTVTVAPSLSVSVEGMTVTETANQTLVVHAGQTDVICLLAKYNVAGAPATPELEWIVLEEGVYNAHVDKAYMLVFAKVALAGGAVVVLVGDIALDERSVVDPVGRDWYRGVVANAAALPTPAPDSNRTGDLYYAIAENALYAWSGAAWAPISMVDTSLAAVVENRHLVDDERNRIEQGSGILAGPRPSTHGAFASVPEVDLIIDATVINQIGFDSFSAIVNGHYVQTYARNLTLPAAPAGLRYDLVFLEVWREIATPGTQTYPRNPAGAATYTQAQVEDLVEEIEWEQGIAGDNIDLTEMAPSGNTHYVTNWRIFYKEDVGEIALYNPSDNAMVATIDTIDGPGNAFAAQPAPAGGVGIDDRVWIGSAPVTSVDGFSWAIPLFVVKRTVSEAGPNNYIQEFRADDNDLRYIFPVYPVCDVSHAARKGVETLHKHEPVPYDVEYYHVDKASGFMTGMDHELSGTGDALAWRPLVGAFPKVRIRGLDEWINTGVNTVDLGGAPAGAGSWDRTLVYLKMNITLYTDDPNKLNYMISQKHRPYIPSYSAGDIRGQGWKRGNVQWTIVADNLGAVDVLDEDDAMVAAAVSPKSATSWSRGDCSLPVGEQYEDGGIWSRVIQYDEDDRVHPYQAEWAIPVALIHRRNSTAWTYDTNPNGTTASRPDDRTDDTEIFAEDLVDLRRQVDLSTSDFQDILEKSIDRAMKGTLRTRMANSWVGSTSGGEVAGSQILRTDFVGSNVAPAEYNLTQADSNRRIWSDAREFHVVARTFLLHLDSSDSCYSYTAATGAISIMAPTGAHLVRHLPGAFVVDGDNGNTTYLDFDEDPCWSTRTLFYDGTVDYPSPVEAKYVDISVLPTVEAALPFSTPFSVDALTLDNLGNATKMDGVVQGAPIGAAVASLSWWVHYDRTDSSADNYDDNYGLAEIPDEVHAITRDTGASGGGPFEINVGTIYAIVRKSIVNATTTTISTANILAAYGGSGAAVTIVGLDQENIAYSSPAGGAISSVTMTPAQDALTINWAGANFTATVDVIVFFYTDDVTQWAEIGRGGKSVRAIFDWWEEDESPVAAYTTPFAFYLPDVGTWQPAEVAGRFVAMPMIWHRNLVGDDWTYLPLGPSGGTPAIYAGYPYSNLVSLTDLNGVMTLLKIVVPRHLALSSAAEDELQIDYTYTPYQGLSGDGAQADLTANLVRLKAMMHGRVEANTEMHATQSGACSYFGGVDAFNGWPARVPDRYENFLSSRFTMYNATQLVKPLQATGTQELGHASNFRDSLNAAAILRLPFPSNPLMQDGSNFYHNVTMDWDLDPGREGAGAGYFSFAPGYPGSVTVGADGINHHIVMHQFVNGLARLAVPGEPKQKNETIVVPACAFQEDTGGSYTQAYDGANMKWGVDSGDSALLTADLNEFQYSLINNTLTAVNNVFDNVGTDAFTTSGMYHKTLFGFALGAPATYTILLAALPGLPATVTLNGDPIFVVTCPGTIFAYYKWRGLHNPHPLFILGLVAGADAGVREIHSTYATVDSARASYISGHGFMLGEHLDLIKTPLGSINRCAAVAQNHSGYYAPYSSGQTDLRGLSISYPPSWDATSIATLEALLAESVIFHTNYGRGFYLGNTTSRQNMPVLVPGSGTPLDVLAIAYNSLLNQVDDQPPDPFPMSAGAPVFAQSNRRWVTYDHGGSLAYLFYGMIINPHGAEYNSRAVMQITGGPTMGEGNQTAASLTPDGFDGNAVDIFWPVGRGILAHGKSHGKLG